MYRMKHKIMYSYDKRQERYYEVNEARDIFHMKFPNQQCAVNFSLQFTSYYWQH